MTSQAPPAPAAPPAVRPGRSSLPEYATAAGSGLGVLAGVWWWLEPAAYPLAVPDPMSLVAGPWSTTKSVLLIAFGLLGVVAALAMRRTAGPRSVVVGAAAVQVGVLLGVVADIRALMLLGYLMALTGPAILLGVLAVGAWRSAAARYALLGLLAAGAALGYATGAGPDSIVEIGRAIAAAMPDKGLGILLVGATVALGSTWVWTLVRYLRRTRGQCVSCGRPGGAWSDPVRVARWGRWVTIAAAAGPLPYALLRMTWLTPWPSGFDAAALAAHPELRLFGVALGLAALGGCVLTLGLIRPWGEVFPRWIPGLRGRAVPVLLPTTIGLAVGAAVTVAGRSMLQLMIADPSDLPLLVVFPMPVWGPLLIAASLAYYLRRRGHCTTCDQG